MRRDAHCDARDAQNTSGKGSMMLSLEVKSRKFPGVYYRELENKDRSYFLRIRIDGKVKRIPIGKKSEGITEAFCNQEKNRILNASRFGEDVARQLQKVKQEEPTFVELFEYYLSKRELKASTIEKLQVLKSLPFAKSRKVSRADIQAYIDDLKKSHRPETVNLRFRQVRAVFRYAISREKYKHPDPTAGIDLPKATGPRKRYFSHDEIEMLLKALESRPRIRLFAKMALCTGARISTLLTVHSDHIQPDGSVALYNHKGSRWYTGFFDKETMRLLKGKKGYVLALPGKEDKPASRRSVQYGLQTVLNELFNTPDTPIAERAVIHTLRHSVASRMIEKGVPLEIVSKTLDHSGIAITAQVYGKISPDLIRKSVKNLWG